MLNLEDAIKHAEEVAEENYGKATEYQYQCNELSKCLKCGDEHMQLAEWLKDYKRLKEQEPCEDAISRQAVEDKLTELCNSLEEIFANIRMTNVDESVCGLCEYDCPAPFECKGFETNECFKLADEIRHKWQSTKNLSSVKPQEKKGHWISFGVQGEMDGGQIVQAFTCSECGTISIFRMRSVNIVNGNICPTCGAKMEVENNG